MTNLKQILPDHVAVIMDGNGRWAKQRFLPRSAGHRAGMNRMIELAEYLFSKGIRFVTLYALSAENLSRPKEELNALFTLFREYFSNSVRRLKDNGVRLHVIGNTALLPLDVQMLIRAGEAETSDGEGGTLILAIAYGARQDILRAVNLAIGEGKPLTEEAFTKKLSTGAFPPPDLLIRTGREKRLSNFLLYEAAYAELYFSDKMFPSFTNADMERALLEYARRDRRYGGVSGEEMAAESSAEGN